MKCPREVLSVRVGSTASLRSRYLIVIQPARFIVYPGLSTSFRPCTHTRGSISTTSLRLPFVDGMLGESKPKKSHDKGAWWNNDVGITGSV